jgi:hypothetical protein
MTHEFWLSRAESEYPFATFGNDLDWIFRAHTERLTRDGRVDVIAFGFDEIHN